MKNKKKRCKAETQEVGNQCSLQAIIIGYCLSHYQSGNTKDHAKPKKYC